MFLNNDQETHFTLCIALLSDSYLNFILFHAVDGITSLKSTDLLSLNLFGV